MNKQSYFYTLCILCEKGISLRRLGILLYCIDLCYSAYNYPLTTSLTETKYYKPHLQPENMRSDLQGFSNYISERISRPPHGMWHGISYTTNENLNVNTIYKRLNNLKQNSTYIIDFVLDIFKYKEEAEMAQLLRSIPPYSDSDYGQELKYTKDFNMYEYLKNL